jgi:hypothetical protein
METYVVHIPTLLEPLKDLKKKILHKDLVRPEKKILYKKITSKLKY